MAEVIRPDPERTGNGPHGAGGAGQWRATVAVTERALGALAALRGAEHALPRQALGLVLGPGGSVGLVLDLPGPRDPVFSRDNVPILFVDAKLGPRLAGRVLDHGGAPGRERFTLERILPDASPSDQRSR
jgi:hypothetical protein